MHAIRHRKMAGKAKKRNCNKENVTHGKCSITSDLDITEKNNIAEPDMGRSALNTLDWLLKQECTVKYEVSNDIDLIKSSEDVDTRCLPCIRIASIKYECTECNHTSTSCKSVYDHVSSHCRKIINKEKCNSSQHVEKSCDSSVSEPVIQQNQETTLDSENKNSSPGVTKSRLSDNEMIRLNDNSEMKSDAGNHDVDTIGKADKVKVKEKLPVEVKKAVKRQESKVPKRNKQGVVCPFCALTTGDTKHCYEHMLAEHDYIYKIHPSKKPPKVDENDPRLASGLFSYCKTCGSIMPEGDIDKHIIEKHIRRIAWVRQHRRKPSICAHCGLIFTQTQNLETHIKTQHEGYPGRKHKKQNLVCTFESCEYSTPVRYRLDRHIQSVHYNDAPFKCKHCPYETSERSNFKTHLLRHSDFKRFKCDLCPYQCNQKVQLRKHMKNNHDKNKSSINKKESSVRTLELRLDESSGNNTIESRSKVKENALPTGKLPSTPQVEEGNVRAMVECETTMLDDSNLVVNDQNVMLIKQPVSIENGSVVIHQFTTDKFVVLHEGSFHGTLQYQDMPDNVDEEVIIKTETELSQ